MPTNIDSGKVMFSFMIAFTRLQYFSLSSSPPLGLRPHLMSAVSVAGIMVSSSMSTVLRPMPRSLRLVCHTIFSALDR